MSLPLQGPIDFYKAPIYQFRPKRKWNFNNRGSARNHYGTLTIPNGPHPLPLSRKRARGVSWGS